MDLDNLRHVWEAFCCMNDAQDAIALGFHKEASKSINHAKQHLDRVMPTNYVERADIIYNSSLVCQLIKEDSN